MALNKIFFVYMALAGAAAGAILVAAPNVQDFVIKPYFWVLIAVGLFDGGSYLFARNARAVVLTMNARLIGFGIGIALMVAIPFLAGTPVRFL
jgi:hypothetical protein